MNKFYFLVALAVLLDIHCLCAQEHTEESLHRNDKGIYIGHVNGISPEEFVKFSTWDTVFGLTHLTKSKNLIEIRFFEIPSSMNIICTRLYYDTVFKLERYFEIPLSKDTSSKWITKEFQPLKAMNPDTIFHKLVRTGIFSYTPTNSSVPRQVLRKTGIENYDMICTTMDGTSYSIHIKIGNLYRRLYFNSSPDFKSKCYPEFWDFKRQYEIITLLETRLQTFTK